MEQNWDPTSYAANAAFVPVLGAPLLELLRARKGETILDLGCGDGTLTRRIAEAGATVVGADASAALVAAACAAGVDARLMNGQALTFDSEFDAVFSNAALHWMPRADDVLGGIVRALRPQGRLVAEFGGHGNVAAIVVALLAVTHDLSSERVIQSPWFFPTAEEYAAMLTKHGFKVDQIALIPRPTFLPTGMEGWLDVFAHPFLHTLPLEDQAATKKKVVQLLRPALCDRSGRWIADYVRLRLSAHLR